MGIYSVPMALADFIPNILFLLASLNIFKFLKTKNVKCPKVIYAVGFSMIFAASMLKALYKLICALNIADIKWMTNQFFPNQSLGFLICGIALVASLISSKKMYSFIPTMALVGIMVAGVAMQNISLAIFAKKEKAKGAPIMFIVSLFLSLCMGYLSTKDFAQSYMNWAAEGVNILSMLLLFLGSKKIYKKA